MKLHHWLGILVGCFIVAGCAHHERYPTDFPAYSGPQFSPTNNAPSLSPPIMTPANVLQGQVTSANENLRFVVLTFQVGQMPAIGRHLSVYRNGLKVGELTVTGPQNDDSIVADITAGQASKGDTVRDQ